MLQKIKSHKIIAVGVGLLLVFGIVGGVAWSQQRSQEQGGSAYIGLSEQSAVEKAEEQGIPYRVVERDDEFIIRTDDLRRDRINFSVEDGRVVKAELY